MGKYLYMAVTVDEFEFPIVVEDSIAELANRFGIEPISVKNSIERGYSGKNMGRRFIKVKNL